MLKRCGRLVKFLRASQCRNLNIAVAMSGGIDSAVCALLLKQKGHNVSGIFMKNWDMDDEEGGTACSLHQDLLDMKEVCRRLNIPSHEVSFVREYWTNVFMPFIELYESGEGTPNPDVYCNSYIKFSSLREHVIQKLGFDMLATGHYAGLNYISSDTSSSLQLKRGVDSSKDQSYFLCTTNIDHFRNVMFPLGDMTKAEIKRIAATSPLLADLNVSHKKESMGVCFIGRRKMDEFLPQYFTPTSGRFIDVSSGAVMGSHTGAQLFTAGQKCRIGGCAEKYYIIKKMKSGGDVFVGVGHDHPGLFSEVLVADWTRFNWSSLSHRDAIVCEMEVNGMGILECEMQFRHRQTPVRCRITVFKATVEINEEGASPLPLEHAPVAHNECTTDGGEVVLKVDCVDGPVRAASPGQILAIYDGNICLGGGPIKHTYSSFFDSTYCVNN